MNAKTASIIFGFAFLLVGVFGFVPNVLISDSHEAVFHTDAIHNSVHIISGLLFFTIAFAKPDFAGTFLKIFGAVYFLLGVLGLINFGIYGMGELLGFLHVNGADNILHIVLGLAIFIAGTMGSKAKPG